METSFFSFCFSKLNCQKKALKETWIVFERKQSSLGNNAEIVGSDALAFSSGLPVTVIDICCFLLFAFFSWLLIWLTLDICRVVGSELCCY